MALKVSRVRVDLPEGLQRLLMDLYAYMEGKADADGDSEGYRPNDEMVLLSRLQDWVEEVPE